MAAMKTATGITYRWLEPGELRGIEPLFKARNWIPLNPELCRVIAAFDGDTMIGFCAFNMIPHVEPLFVDLKHRGSGVAEELVKQMVEFLYIVQAPAAYIVADNPASEQLAKLHGMELVTSPVYRKVV